MAQLTILLAAQLGTSPLCGWEEEVREDKTRAEKVGVGG